MSDKTLKIISILVLSTLIGLLIWLVAGGTIKNQDKILHQTADSIYVKKYTLYNKDSVVVAFKQTKIYDGVVTKKNTGILVL